MATAGETRIHERLDELFTLAGNTDKKVAVLVAGCEPCRRAILGNARPGLTTRVDRLEEARKGKGWWFRAIAMAVFAAAVSILSGTAVAIASAALGN